MTVGRVVVYPQKNGQAVSLDETKCRPQEKKNTVRAVFTQTTQLSAVLTGIYDRFKTLGLMNFNMNLI